MTIEPIDEFTEDVARQIVAVKNDPIARRDYMVLATRIKDAKREGFVEGEAKGLAEGQAKGEVQGKANQIVSMVERKMQLKHMTCEEAMDDLDCTPEERQAYYDCVAKSK
ncbi:MAG: hypothetical protein ACI3XH_07185 [Phascolarctobacterium sp.]